MKAVHLRVDYLKGPLGLGKATDSSVGWTDAVYLIPYRFARRFADHAILRESWPMITVPPNCTATVRLPDGSEQQIQSGVYTYVR